MSHSIAKTNDLSYAGAVVTSNLEVSRNKEAFRKELLWRQRLANSRKELRKDLSQIKAVGNLGKKIVDEMREEICLYRDIKVVTGELKQSVVSVKHKIVLAFIDLIDRDTNKTQAISKYSTLIKHNVNIPYAI